MTGRWKRILIRISVVALLIHFVIEITGHHYLYKTIQMTILKGQLGPDIEEYRSMPNASIYGFDPEYWPKKQSYGTLSLSAEDEAYHEQNESVSFVVIHNDSMIHEEYWDGFSADSISNSFSMAKSIVGLLVGIAIDQKAIESVDKPIYWYFPEYKTELGKELTVKHLLTMSSGINFDEDYLNPFAFPAKANYGDNLELLIQEYEVTETPGLTFEYKSGNTQILSFLVSGLMRKPVSELATEHIWSKIGAEHRAFWTLDRIGGSEKAFCCINATARDFARIGRVYKDHGMWDDERIVDSAYIAASISKQSTVNPDGSPCETYGYHWWLGEEKGLEFFFMRGIKGQYVLVVPEKDLIVVRLGRKRDNGTYERPHPDDVYRYLNMGLKMIGE